MVVDDLDVEGIRAAPHEADSPLIVDSNAVLSLPRSLQRLEAISGRDTKILQGDGPVQKQQFPARCAFEGSKAWDIVVMKEIFRCGRGERPDHCVSVYRLTGNDITVDVGAALAAAGIGLSSRAIARGYVKTTPL